MKNLSNFFRHNFAVRQQELSGLLSLVAPCLLAGNPLAADDLLDEEDSIGVQLVSPTRAGTWEAGDPDAPDDCVAVVSLSGFLYAGTTDRLMGALGALEAAPNVLGVVLAIDGPGGHATRVEIAAERIRNYSKPVATLVMGMMCSAHFWIGTAAEHVFTASDLCQIGSVGVLTQYMGMGEYLRKIGMDFREIYPDSSDLKNYESRAIADRNDEEPMKETLGRLHDEFPRAVALQLGID
ncbi:MAG: S49 family peptidase, partial [Muribaculaceae bacterium]|nr:S49 family peptidase [Muribaculaceae bacterium]